MQIAAVKNQEMPNNDQCYSEKPLSLMEKTDLFLLYVLIAFILLFQLQVVFEWIHTLRIREILYGYLYFRVFIFYPLKLNKVFLLLLSFLFLTLLAGTLTYIIYDYELAASTFMRFTNVALLAPLSAIIFTKHKHFRYFVVLWVVIYLMGAFTAIYQFLGGDMSWLFQDYLAIRGSLVRFRTLLGEPNVGGMASVIVFTLTIFVVKNNYWKACLMMISVVVLALSISKGAFASLFLLILLVVIFFHRSLFYIKRDVILKLSYIFILVLIIFTLFFLLVPDYWHSFLDYAETTAISIGGRDEPIGGLLWQDFVDRTVNNPKYYYINGIYNNDLYPLNIIIGSSLGVTGSAAIDSKDYIGLPHNSYLEIFIAGGLIMLIIFILLLLAVYKRLKVLRGEDGSYVSILIIFLIIVILLLSYPIIYQPVLGSFFWVIVGIACNPRFLRSRSGRLSYRIRNKR